MATANRVERLQIMLSDGELAAVDDWRLSHRMPSRAAAVRELLKRGLVAEGFLLADKLTQSKEFGLLAAKPKRRSPWKTPPSRACR